MKKEKATSAFAKNIKFVRESLWGMRLDFFAKNLGVSAATVISWESGKSMPHPSRLAFIAKFIDERAGGAGHITPRALCNWDFEKTFPYAGELFKIKHIQALDDEMQLLDGRTREESYQPHRIGLELLLEDTQLIRLMKLTSKELEVLKSIHFHSDFNPPKQFYIDALDYYRRQKQKESADGNKPIEVSQSRKSN